jgi:hypothetical protein
MRTSYRYAYGGRAKPVNTAGGLTMLKPKHGGEPTAEQAYAHGKMGKIRLDKRERGGRIAGEPKPGERIVSPREKAEAGDQKLEHHVSAREKAEIGAKSGGRKWIAGAIKHPGALTASAKKAGMSPMAFASKHEHDSGTTGRRARLALTLRGFHKK